jgi:sRNA-binding carbon storage regulator CsrA
MSEITLLCVCVQRMKIGIVGPKETAVSRQRLGKHVPAANTHGTTEELFDAVFSMR